MWIERSLAEIATITSGGTPARDVEGYWGGEIPWVTPSDITACTTNVLRETKERITAAGLAASAARMVPAESVLLTSRATVGEARIAGMPLCTNQGFKALTAGPGIDPWFLFYQVQRCRGQFERFAAGSTFLEIGKRDTERVRLGHPADVASQKRIAAILTSLDTAIEATEALIEKHQQIKAGLMLDLFTRGMTADGQLRPAPAEARGLYQVTKLGLLPATWRVERLGDLVNPARPIVYGILMPGYGFPGGVPVVKVKDIRDRRIAFEDLLLTSPQIDNEYRRSRLKPGDVLFTIRGTVGRVAVVPEVLEGANITQDTARMDLTGVSGEFASYYFETPMAKRFFDVNTLGVAVQGINLGELRKLLVPVPPPPEQERIVAMVAAAYRRIDSENAVLEKLRMQKQGLMQDLLTGKVPVRAD